MALGVILIFVYLLKMNMDKEGHSREFEGLCCLYRYVT